MQSPAATEFTPPLVPGMSQSAGCEQTRPEDCFDAHQEQAGSRPQSLQGEKGRHAQLIRRGFLDTTP